MINGAGGWNSGDIFIDVDGDAEYGIDAFGLDGLSGDGVKTISNAYGYDYVFDLDVSKKTCNVYSLDGNSELESVHYRSNDGANPWRYREGAVETLAENKNFGYSDWTGTDLFEGNFHNALTVDLGYLGDVLGDGFLAHFTMECGNDTIRGQTLVPEPSTMLLLGFGLVGLAGFGRRKLKKN